MKMGEFFLLLTLLGLSLSMLFSASEASIFSLSRIDFASLKSLGLKEKYLSLLKNTEQLLFTLLAGNELADYFASFAFATAVTLLLSEEYRTPAFFIFSLLSFWLGDFFPKVAGFKLRTRLILKIIPITYLFYKLFYPISLFIYEIYLKINKLFPKPEKESKFSFFTPVEQVIIYSVELACKEGKLSETEKEFIYGLFLSEKISISAVMTPRSEIVAFRDQPITLDFLTKIKHLPYNKFPVYRDSLDEVVGVLYTKDLINYLTSQPDWEGKWLSNLVRPTYFVPETLPVRELLFEFQRKNLKIALIVDEYGSIKGLVTLEDILEELFGEILPEKEEMIEPIEKIREDYYLISGQALLEEVKEVLALSIEEDICQDLKTMNGFILTLYQGIPKEGEVLIYKNWKFKIKKVRGRKILWIEAEKGISV